MLAIEEILARLGMGLLLGALIGVERQWRQRMAGLRTNALVSLGAASFTLISMMVPGDASPTRVASQVVSGIGFLGAGVILREGLNIRGLNTAATLWCAAAVGVSAGNGYFLAATLTAAFIIAANLTLRPLVRLIDRQPMTVTEMEHQYQARVLCQSDREAHLRALLLQGIARNKLRLRQLESHDVDRPDMVEVRATMVAPTRQDEVLEEIVGRLSLEPSVDAASWSVQPRED